jgi:hypothetical protein
MMDTTDHNVAKLVRDDAELSSLREEIRVLNVDKNMPYAVKQSKLRDLTDRRMARLSALVPEPQAEAEPAPVEPARGFNAALDRVKGLADTLKEIGLGNSSEMRELVDGYESGDMDRMPSISAERAAVLRQVIITSKAYRGKDAKLRTSLAQLSMILASYVTGEI